MDRFTIHFCGEEKVVNITIGGAIPTTAFTIGASGGTLEVPYSGCVSAVLVQEPATYSIDRTNNKILFNIPSNSGEERVIGFTVVWCDGSVVDAIITQEEGNGFYQDTLVAPFSGGTLVASYHGCLSSITISDISYSIDTTNKTVTFVMPPNSLEYEVEFNFIANWCDGTTTSETIIQNAHPERNFRLEMSWYDTSPRDTASPTPRKLTEVIMSDGVEEVSRISATISGESFSMMNPILVSGITSAYNSSTSTCYWRFNWGISGENVSVTAISGLPVQCGIHTCYEDYILPDGACEHEMYMTGGEANHYIGHVNFRSIVFSANASHNSGKLDLVSDLGYCKPHFWLMLNNGKSIEVDLYQQIY